MRDTAQKRAIRDALSGRHDHPTATMLAEQLHSEGKKVSRATVFRVLSEAAEAGEINRLQLEKEDVRYDYNTAPHYHLRCRVCGSVTDSRLPYMAGLNDQASEEDFSVQHHSIAFEGVCGYCRKKERKAGKPE